MMVAFKLSYKLECRFFRLSSDVLAQSAISSQLIDNLNASIHLRALLTDLFLLGEILRKKSKPAVEVVTGDGA